MRPSQHILIHLDNFISFSSIAAASLATFKSFGAGYLTIDREPPIMRCPMTHFFICASKNGEGLVFGQFKMVL